MSLITRIRKQQAVYWAKKELPDAFGQPQYEDLVPMMVRWESSQELVEKENR